MKIYNILMITAIVATTILAAGCGRNKAPDPPLARTRIVISLFDNLRKKQYQNSVQQIDRLQALDPESVFLHQLKESELSNQYMEQAQIELGKGNLQAAVNIIDKGRNQYPFNDNLIQAENKLSKLIMLNKYIAEAQAARDADTLETILNNTKKLLTQIPNGERLQKFIRLELIRAHKLQKREAALARFDLLCDIKTMRNKKDPVAEAMQAEFDLVNSDPKLKSVAIRPDLLDE
ncbi:hypothetical protein P0136_02640 [Lentisphaerota bacterium ZTH]|nr:hypothetical protein JYG24_06220 [Lentisphaerota bacterium]WET06899.1 hypothetical protein P0136_02640 [Lentisphaerota bacterium ZTH]